MAVSYTHLNGFFAIDSRCLPQVISVTRGRAEMLGIPFVITDFSEGLPEGDLYGIVPVSYTHLNVHGVLQRGCSLHPAGRWRHDQLLRLVR